MNETTKFVLAWMLGVVSVYWLLFLNPYIILHKNWVYSSSDLERLAHITAILHDIDPKIFVAQMRQESQFNQYARSKAGALGVAQIMPNTAKSWKVDPYEPTQALDAAARNMAGFIRTYKVQGHDERTAYKLALAAYNAGPGIVAKYGGIPPYRETRAYISIVMRGK